MMMVASGIIGRAPPIFLHVWDLIPLPQKFMVLIVRQCSGEAYRF